MEHPNFGFFFFFFDSYADSYAHFGELLSEPPSTLIFALCGLYIMAIVNADASNFDRRV